MSGRRNRLIDWVLTTAPFTKDVGRKDKMDTQRCIAKTQSGKRCRNAARHGSQYCHRHTPVSPQRHDEERTLRFSRALFYPYIEINDEAWLKTQCLYWDSISTIVPAGLKCYTTPTARYLHEANILRPFRVRADMSDVYEAGNEAMHYLETKEGAAVLRSGSERTASVKIRRLARMAANETGRIHGGKMAPPVVERVLKVAGGKWPRAQFLRVPRTFADYYMTLLASCIGRNHGYSILTHLPNRGSLATRSMLGVRPDSTDQSRVPAQVAEGLLAYTILRTVAVGPRTSVKKLVKFREQHAAALGRFRAATRELVESLSGDLAPEALQTHIETLYSDNVLPALDELTGRLRDNRIACGYNNLKLSTLASASPTVLGTILTGTAAGPFALAAGAGLSVVLSIANYRVQRRDLLRSSPFSYVASAQAQLGKS